jgi:hypothetical protein
MAAWRKSEVNKPVRLAHSVEVVRPFQSADELRWQLRAGHPRLEMSNCQQDSPTQIYQSAADKKWESTDLRKPTKHGEQPDEFLIVSESRSTCHSGSQVS